MGRGGVVTMSGGMPRMTVVEDKKRRTDCSWTEGRVTWDGRGRGNDGILLKTGTALIDGVGNTEVEVGEAMTVGVGSEVGTCTMEETVGCLGNAEKITDGRRNKMAAETESKDSILKERNRGVLAVEIGGEVLLREA
jgi:hypothetical protein